MEIYCADCGCLVERGSRIAPCGTDACCCLDLPIKLRTPEQIADQLREAFETKDLGTLGRLVAADARWGDDDNPNRCRSRTDVVATFDRLLGEGVDGSIAERVVGPNGVAVLLHVEWPEPGEGRDISMFQSWIVRNGVVAEIQRHDDRRSAVAAISN